MKELGRKVKEKVKKEKESVLRKHGEYREIPGEEEEDDDDDDEDDDDEDNDDDDYDYDEEEQEERELF